MSDGNHPRYFQALDGLRAVAVACVLWVHYLPQEYWPLDVNWGAYGVRLFFVISGFLITDILLRASEAGCGSVTFYSHFIARRLARLYPALAIFILICLVLNIDHMRRDIEWHAFYLSNFMILRREDWGAETAPLWSLAVEQQFYLVWPFVILCTKGRLRVVLLTAAFLAAPIFRLVWINAGLSEFGVWVMPPAIADALGAGALAAVTADAGARWRIAWRIAALVGAELVLAAAIGVPQAALPMGVGELGASMLFGFAVFSIAQGPPAIVTRVFANGPIRYIGAISYGIYIYHMLPPALTWRILGSQMLDIWTARALWTVLTLVIAAASFQLIETPVRRRVAAALNQRAAFSAAARR